MKENFHFRQGDVLIVKMNETPDLTGFKKRENGILAYGEATGHHHMVMDPETMAVYEKAGEDGTAESMMMVMTVSENGISLAGTPGGTIAHLDSQRNRADHSPINCPPGNYRVIIQTEFVEDRSRNVLD